MLLLEDKYICRKSQSGMERFLLTAPAFQLLARNFQEISARCQFYCDFDYLALTSAHQLKQQNPMAPQYPRHNDAVRTLRLPPQTLAHKYPRRYPRAAANNKKKHTRTHNQLSRIIVMLLLQVRANQHVANGTGRIISELILYMRVPFITRLLRRRCARVVAERGPKRTDRTNETNKFAN